MVPRGTQRSAKQPWPSPILILPALTKSRCSTRFRKKWDSHARRPLEPWSAARPSLLTPHARKGEIQRGAPPERKIVEAGRGARRPDGAGARTFPSATTGSTRRVKQKIEIGDARALVRLERRRAALASSGTTRTRKCRRLRRRTSKKVFPKEVRAVASLAKRTRTNLSGAANAPRIVRFLLPGSMPLAHWRKFFIAARLARLPRTQTDLGFRNEGLGTRGNLVRQRNRRFARKTTGRERRRRRSGCGTRSRPMGKKLIVGENLSTLQKFASRCGGRFANSTRSPKASARDPDVLQSFRESFNAPAPVRQPVPRAALGLPA